MSIYNDFILSFSINSFGILWYLTLFPRNFKTKMIQYPLNNLTATIQFYTPVVKHQWIGLQN
jgi:hypothetical protein